MRFSRVPCLVLAALSALLPVAAAAASEVDLSCMSLEVKGKTQVTDRHKEYDVALTNACPGPVYWAMCIERLDPYTNRVLESHTPTGYIDADQKIRVNLQMKKGPAAMDFRQRFQEFYVAPGYAIERPATARCVASQCEAARRDVRGRLRANLDRWEAAVRSLEARLSAECPESGWGKTEAVEQCESGIRAEAQPRLDELAGIDAGLREELRLAGPAGCDLYAGELVPD